MGRHRNHFAPEDKLSILRRHLQGKVPVATVCAEAGIGPSLFYQWQKQFFEDGPVVFRPALSAKRDRREKKAPNPQGDVTDQSSEAELNWMIALTHGHFAADDDMRTMRDTPDREDLGRLLTCIRYKPLKYRNRAVAILSFHRGIRVSHIARFLGVSHSSVDNWVRKFTRQGCQSLLAAFTSDRCRAKDKRYRNAVFEILHAPPSTHGINRTTWRLQDIHSEMAKRGLSISRHTISGIIKAAGYRYRKAKKVLTSSDPTYKEKLREVTRILSSLSEREKFFSIDESGPFAVKMQGGRCLVPKGYARAVPQRQRSKGTLIITGALELSTNQVTHFYSPAKNTAEMVKLLDILVEKYADQNRIYFSWDAASWHASKKLYERVHEINDTRGLKWPEVRLVPLPSCSQFLNVIESVFSGMARAVLHNSDYAGVDECIMAINRHFEERNVAFRDHPRRAGNNIWGKERVKPRFSESNNCKDPRYQ